MPELPDLTIYLDALERRVVGRRLLGLRLGSPFVLRSVDPAPADVAGRKVVGLRRLGKRLVLELAGDLFVVLHLMIAGRLKWGAKGAKLPGKIGLAALDFEDGSVLLTEASPKKRASIHLVRGEAGLLAFVRSGIEPLSASLPEFTAALRREVHTLKRTLTDPDLFAGIGNAYSDEILHRAQLSPTQRTDHLDEEEVDRLYRSTQQVLTEWIARLREETGTGWPEKVTAFRPHMAVHGRFGLPCPVCGTKVQRIRYADNECNYCPRCQTEGRLLADRGLSRLLGKDWPKRIEELEG
ncbi:MAG TPA: DNA-formamidopyrimidine glycosylase family protein [Candidatus Polarisedimenticolaceae bacterium]|nr:DNA-formamidopyrimidine glycosylase family protein [Candidatus Polarisedimenticolaceae bacterium]